MRLKAVQPLPPKFRVGITGSRSLVGRDRVVLNRWLKGLGELEVDLDPARLLVVHGACRGPDMVVARWAVEEGYEIRAFPAEWAVLGPAAGPKRNARMVAQIDALVAVWDGKSDGTADMVYRARERELPVSVQWVEPLRTKGLLG